MTYPSRSISETELLENLGWIQILARSLVRDATTADDVTQDTCLRALERPPRAREGAGLRAWLARVTRSRARTSMRSARNRARYENESPHGEPLPSTLEVVERAATQRVVVEELMRLEEPDRSTVLLRYLDGLTASEIARQRGESPAAVRKRLSRALATLRARLEPRLGGREALFSSLAALGGPGRLALLTKPVLIAGALSCVSAIVVWIATQTSAQDPPLELVALQNGELLAGGAQLLNETRSQESMPSTARTAVPRERSALRFAGRAIDLPYPGLNEEATPARGVTVNLTIDQELERQATTDDEGRFEIVITESVERPPQEQISVSYWIHADDDYRIAGSVFQLEPTGVLPEEIVIERAAHGALVGQVVDQGGDPLARVRITTRATWVGISNPGPEETFTDEDGNFDLGVIREGIGLSATKRGWRQMERVIGALEKAGGWKPSLIVMATAGSLALEVQGEDGAPRSGVTVVAGVSNDELTARGDKAPHVTGITAADGRVLLEDVWSGVKLRLQVRGVHGAFETERSQQGVLTRSGELGGAALVVPSGGVLELLARLPDPLRVHGRVLDERREPVPGASVFLLVPNELSFSAAEEVSGALDGFGRRRAVQADAEGRFDVGLILQAELAELRIVATNGGRDLSPYSSAEVADYTAAASVVLAHEELTPEDELELILVPAQSITGVVHGPDGTPVAGRVGFRCTDELPRTRLDKAEAEIEGDGSFTLAGLLPGTYDLEVEVADDNFFTWSRIPRSFNGIEAGVSGIELVITEPELVNVTIAATLDGAPVKFAGMLGMHIPDRARPVGGTPTARKLTVSRLDGWPTRATLGLVYGQAGARSDHGSERFMYLESSEEAYTFEPVAPGWYRIGVRGWTEAEEALHPSGTGLVYLESGDYRFDFELRRVGDLRGRVAGQLDPDLCVGLVDARGGPVHTRRRQDFAGPVSPIGADGSFWLQAAPSGTFTLSLGTEEDFRAQRWVHREAIEIVAGQTLEVEIELP